MNLAERTKQRKFRRKMRARNRIRATFSHKPRLSVFRSSSHIYAQLIDDTAGKTIAAASSLDKELREKLKSGGNVAAAKAVGTLVAQRILKAGVKEIAFDRGASRYHGRVKALADAAREAGLKF